MRTTPDGTRRPATTIATSVAAITALNRDERTGPNPDEFNYIP